MRLWLIFAILWAPSALAESTTQAEFHGKTIDRIQILGVDRTQPEVIKGELTYREGDKISAEDLEESLIRLRNTELFATVQQTIASIDGEVVSRIEVVERWTTIPIFKFNRGGGVNHLVVGAYDINLWGRFLEGGLQAERLGDASSAVIWYRNPRFLGQRMRLAADLWSINRVRLLYANRGETADLADGFLHRRDKLRIGLSKEWRWWLTTAAIIEARRDSFQENYLPEEIENPTMPEASQSTLLGVDADLGRVRKNGWLVDGYKLTNQWRQSLTVEDKAKDFYLYETNLLAYSTIFNNHTVALRLGAGISTAKAEQELFYVGGLDKLRGYKDGRFRGRNFWLGNWEYRLPSWQSQWVVLQHTVFYDAAAAFDDLQDWRKRDGQSVGLGLRFIAPRIYRLVGRLDWARSRDGTTPLSFGVQQFF